MDQTVRYPHLGRRGAMTAAGAMALSLAGSAAFPRRAQADGEAVRLGILQFGTVQWVADVMARDKLDAAHGFALHTTPLANNDAGRVALMAGAADIVVADWPFVATQRAAGTKLVFSPFSLATGGIMTKADAKVAALADLKGMRLGVAGGPVDKSWLVVQAAAKRAGIDLPRAASVVYGAPPLLSAKLQQGELDAVLTFWNYAAKLEAAGYREAISVTACANAIGLPPRTSLVGFVFREDWGTAHRAAADGFLAAAAAAQARLSGASAEWDAVRPLMDAPDDATFARLKARFADGVPVAADLDPETEQRNAEKLFAVLRETGGSRATGDIDALPDGIFWHGPNGAG